MGCNCGKKRKRPTPTTQRTQPKPTGDSQKKDEQTFELVTGSNRTLTFGSRLEAEAANVRAGGTGRVRPKR